jgi:hypothetical protein
MPLSPRNDGPARSMISCAGRWAIWPSYTRPAALELTDAAGKPEPDQVEDVQTTLYGPVCRGGLGAAVMRLSGPTVEPKGSRPHAAGDHPALPRPVGRTRCTARVEAFAWHCLVIFATAPSDAADHYKRVPAARRDTAVPTPTATATGHEMAPIAAVAASPL